MLPEHLYGSSRGSVTEYCFRSECSVLIFRNPVQFAMARSSLSAAADNLEVFDSQGRLFEVCRIQPVKSVLEV